MAQILHVYTDLMCAACFQMEGKQGAAICFQMCIRDSPMGVSLTSDGKVNFAAALHTKEECGVLLYLHTAGKPLHLPFTDKNRVGNIYCMQLEGLADVQFQYNFYAGEDIITDPYAGVIYGNERWGRQAEPRLRGGMCRHCYDWENDAPLMTPLSDTVLYLIHPRGFTCHSSSGVQHRGCLLYTSRCV